MSTFAINFWILYLVSIICSATGFYKFLYFISVGYGLSISGLGLALIILYDKALTPGTTILCVLLILYGLRLAGYILYREKTTTFEKVTNTGVKTFRDYNPIAVFFIWTSCALLYVLMASPVFFRLANGDGSDLSTYIGAAVMLFGVVLESAADYQKYKAKEKDPKRFVSHGLYRIVRCPNFLGELICWYGVFIAGATSIKGTWQWVGTIIGLLMITDIMFAGARRLELRQNKNNKDNKEYEIYKKSTPILIPLIPLYSLEKYWWLKG